MVIRYINSLSGKISERTIGTVKVNDTTSHFLFDTVVYVLARVNLDVKQYRAQGYDGATNMSGHKTGISARVNKLSPLAMFTHFFNHRLNLVAQNIGFDVEYYQAIISVMR